jgi:hypothetical protein
LAKLGIARVTDLNHEKLLGTAFAISRHLAITAFHCVGDTETKEVTNPSVSLSWAVGKDTKANFLVGDGNMDYALLELTEPLPDEFEPLAVGDCAGAKGAYRSLGYPVSLSDFDLASITGTIAGSETTIFEGIPAIQLYSNESAAGLALGGMSGAPVLAGNPETAIGVIRWNPPSSEEPTKGVAGIVYATSISLIRKRHPAIFPGEEQSKAERWKSYVDTLMEYAYGFECGDRRYFFLADILTNHYLAVTEYDETGTVTTGIERLVSNLPLLPNNDLDRGKVQALLDYCVAKKFLTRTPHGIYKEKFEITEEGRLYVVENVINP